MVRIEIYCNPARTGKVAARSYPGATFDRVAPIGAALAIIALTVFLLVRNEPVASPELFFALRIILSFSAATLGAATPGYLNFRWEGNGLIIRAGGALALFALTFFYTPQVSFIEKDKGGPSSSSGVYIGRDNNNSPININPR